MTTSDRRLLWAIAVCAALGVACLGTGVWGLVHPAGAPYWLSNEPVGGIFAGVIFLGLAVGELVHRIRRGPQSPGRHTRG